MPGWWQLGKQKKKNDRKLPRLKLRRNKYISLVLQKYFPGFIDYQIIQFCSLRVNVDLNKKWRRWDLNPRHKAYESSALPTELLRQFIKRQNGTMPDQICQLLRSK